MEETPLRIMTADGHPVFREGLAAILSAQSDMVLVAEAADGNQALNLFRKHRPDVTLLDIDLSGMSGLDVIDNIKKCFPNARFLVLTTHAGDVHVQRALKAGASGYLLKNTVCKYLLDSIRAVHHGQRRIPSDVASTLVEYITAETLTAREVQVLSQVANGNANKIIADRFSISEDTVKAHMKSILSKLAANDRTHAVTIAIRRGILELDAVAS
jgi:DNA-binding NarL/FixJ family response regulator